MARHDSSTRTRLEKSTTTTLPAVELRGVSASYTDGGRRLPVLQDLAFAVDAGEFLAILGPSGSGKSTMLDLIAGLSTPDRGEIWLDGAPVSTPNRLGRSAYMRQRDLLLPWRRVVDNACLALDAAGVPRRESRAIARARLNDFGLADAADAYPAQLSGGMRQRVAFLRTMLAGRSLLLLDEPFGALDALTRGAMHVWLLALLAREPHTVLFVTHDVEEAVLLADRVLVVSAQPARVVQIERIELDRPRSRSVVTSDSFVGIKARLIAALNQPFDADQTGP